MTATYPDLDMDAVATELYEALAYIESLRHTHPYEVLGSPHLTGTHQPIPTTPLTHSHIPVGSANTNTNTNLTETTPQTRPQPLPVAI